jgi:hypothetical protein
VIPFPTAITSPSFVLFKEESGRNTPPAVYTNNDIK